MGHSDPARRIRPKPAVDLNYLHERMEGCEGSVTLHWTRDGFRADKVELRLFERAPEGDNKAAR